MNRKIILVSVAAIMSIILGACRMKSFSYKIRNGYGHKWTYQIAMNSEEFNDIQDRGNSIYLAFDDMYTSTKQFVSANIFSMTDFNVFVIEDINFEVEGKSVHVPVNKKYTVKTESSIFAVEESPDKSLNGYSYFIYRTESKLRINFKKVFKDIDFEIGNEYSMNVTVNYSLDSTSFSKTINYNIKPYETNGSSEWIYNLFPETGI